jgi:hypothetical protein
MATMVVAHAGARASFALCFPGAAYPAGWVKPSALNNQRKRVRKHYLKSRFLQFPSPVANRSGTPPPGCLPPLSPSVSEYHLCLCVQTAVQLTSQADGSRFCSGRGDLVKRRVCSSCGKQVQQIDSHCWNWLCSTRHRKEGKSRWDSRDAENGHAAALRTQTVHSWNYQRFDR